MAQQVLQILEVAAVVPAIGFLVAMAVLAL
jgi:hypothetical protein